MRVLITLDAVGGVWQYGLDLARGLVARGAEPVLAVLGPAPDAAQEREAAAIGGATLVKTQLALDWLSDGPGPVLHAAAAIAQLAADTGAQIVQLNMPTLAASPMPVPAIALTHGCVTTWWQAAKPAEPLARDYHWHRDMTRAGLHRAARVIAPSASYAGTVKRTYGLSEMPQVIHNGRSPLVGSQNAAEPDDCVLTVGRLWDKVKGAELLDRVAARLSVPLMAAGARTGPHGEEAAVNNLALLGQLDGPALAEHLSKRPVFVSAASFEPFGLAVLEAAQAGCALVLSDIATFRELWEGAALFVRHEDEVAYADAIETLRADPALRARMGQAAYRRAARYTPQAMADAMLRTYAEVLGGARAGRAAA